MKTQRHRLVGIASLALLLCSSCKQEYMPPTRWPGSFSIHVIDEDGNPVDKAFFVGGTANGRFQAPGASPPENFSDARGYAAPRSWGKPLLCVMKKGYESVDFRVESIPTNRTLIVVLKRQDTKRKPNKTIGQRP